MAFRFAEATNRDYTHAYQVKRAEFDEMLFRNAAARGAETHEGMRVTEVALDAANGSRVAAEDAEGNARSWRARFVVDASGRDTFFANRMGTKKRNGRNNTAALFGHFKDVATRDGSAEEDGYIGIHLFEHGWFWFIPLHGGIMSVGVGEQPGLLQAPPRQPGGVPARSHRHVPVGRGAHARRRAGDAGAGDRQLLLHAPTRWPARAG